MSATSRFFYIAGFVLYAAVFFKNAWVGDDAFILFHSLDQLLDGNGPRWNLHERVQVFTCPLWYWLLAIMGSVYRNHYINSILLSAACNLLVLWNLHKILADARTWILAVAMLVFSQAYFDFTSSGLENPLAYCLLTLTARFYLNREKIPAEKALLYTAFASGLLLVTRHDMLLFIIPILAHSFYSAKHNHIKMTPALLVLLLPLTCWTLFSLLYYGFPFPNTAYAKLGHVIPHKLLLQRGITYFTTSVLRDFISIAVLAASLFTGFITRNPRVQLITAGIALHLLYIVWIGGDFMRGRFFGWDYLLCVITALYSISQHHQGVFNRFNITASLVLTAMAISWILWTPPVATPSHWGAEPFKMGDSADGITQERYFFFWFTGFPQYLQRSTPLLSDHGWCQDGFEQKRQGIPVATSHTVGMHGFCLGNGGIVIDLLGITDPLLARMPQNPSQKNWRPGHTLRLLPDGYCTSVLNHDNRIIDPAIAFYYDKIRLLTQSANLFSTERLHAIWQMNTGGLDMALDAARNSLMNQSAEQGQQAARDCPAIELPPALIEQLKHPES